MSSPLRTANSNGGFLTERERERILVKFRSPGILLVSYLYISPVGRVWVRYTLGIKDKVGCMIPECEVVEDIVLRKRKKGKGKKGFGYPPCRLTFFLTLCVGYIHVCARSTHMNKKVLFKS